MARKVLFLSVSAFLSWGCAKLPPPSRSASTDQAMVAPSTAAAVAADILQSSTPVVAAQTPDLTDAANPIPARPRRRHRALRRRTPVVPPNVSFAPPPPSSPPQLAQAQPTEAAVPPLPASLPPLPQASSHKGFGSRGVIGAILAAAVLVIIYSVLKSRR